MGLKTALLTACGLLFGGVLAFAAENCKWDPSDFPSGIQFKNTSCASFSSNSAVTFGGPSGNDCGCLVFFQGINGSFLPCTTPCPNYSASIRIQVEETPGNWTSIVGFSTTNTSGTFYVDASPFESWSGSDVNSATAGGAQSSLEAACPSTGNGYRLTTSCTCRDSNGQTLCTQTVLAFSLSGLDCLAGCTGTQVPTVYNANTP